MRIGIDIRPLQAETKHRGIGKSLEFFLKEALPLLKDDLVVFYVDGETEAPSIIHSIKNSRVIKFDSIPLTRKKYIRSVINPWRALHVSPHDIDVLLQYDASLGVPKNVPTVVVFHDLIPYLFHSEEVVAAKTDSFTRTLKNRLAGSAYWQQYQRFLKRYAKAQSIIAISQSSKNDYKKYLNPPKGQRLVTIPHGVDSSFFAPAPKLTSKLSSQITKPFFIYIGGIDYRKNITGLLSDFLELRKTHEAQLVLVGKEFALQSQLDDLGWQKLTKTTNSGKFSADIIRPGFVSQEDLIALLSKAQAFVFPSKYEGFGMPLLEAMAAGCPIITYGNSSLKEVVADTGKILPEGESFTQSMKEALDTPENFKKLTIKAKKRAQSFTWNNTARAIITELHVYDPEKIVK